MNDFTKSLLLSRQLIHFTRVRMLMEVRAIENENPIFTVLKCSSTLKLIGIFSQSLHSSQFTYKLSKHAKCKQSQKNVWNWNFEFFYDFTPLENCSLMMLYKRWAAEIFLKRLESNQSVTQKWWSHATNSSPKRCSFSIIWIVAALRHFQFISSYFFHSLTRMGCRARGDNKS